VDARCNYIKGERRSSEECKRNVFAVMNHRQRRWQAGNGAMLL
jgi:hypothetical protein